ncbi:hypothetical protein [Nitrogeniibacter aestuarii]|uniref:hypothetical protein n=1 Tax=Nitrogeniibacter aestuarii TaxID=2815343 RepID=UPI001D11A750|nr:hypothetical protein [Nitrogeniibacter aestuarii]
MSQTPDRTLFLLVTCSRDASRRDLALQVCDNLVDRLGALDLLDRLVVFDNASTFPEHLDGLPDAVHVCRSDTNLGYWTAIQWVLDHLDQFAFEGMDFIYMIESDLYHSDFSALHSCEQLLDQHPELSSVRTQEFSVGQRWRYDKRLKFLPFHKERSHIALKNAITGEKAWFKRVKDQNGLFISNLHPKLPALHRIGDLRTVFEQLRTYDAFAESDFFAEMMKRHELIGVLDGGIFWSLISWSDRDRVVSGSYGNAKQLETTGYQATRHSKINDYGAARISTHPSAWRGKAPA